MSTEESITSSEALCLSWDLEKEEEIKCAIISHRIESWRPRAARESEHIYSKTKPLLWTESLTDSIPNCREVKNK